MSNASAQSHRFVYVAAIFAALGGLLFGYDTGVISGALLFIRRAFALSTFAQEVVVSAVLVGATGGAVAGGRRRSRSTCPKSRPRPPEDGSYRSSNSRSPSGSSPRT